MATVEPPTHPRFLVDTDVLIDYLRGFDAAAAWLEKAQGTLLVSAVTVAELYAGVREGDERVALEAFLSAFEMVPVDEAIARRGGLLRRDYRRSHATALADALIAATAQERCARLVTLNRSHFPMLDEILTPYEKD